MTTRAKRITAAVIVVLLCVGLLYSRFGWLHNNDEILNYIARHCDIDGSEIVNGELLSSTGGTDGEGTKLYRVTAENGESQLVRLDVVYCNKIFMIGPEVRVKDIEILG